MGTDTSVKLIPTLHERPNCLFMALYQSGEGGGLLLDVLNECIGLCPKSEDGGSLLLELRGAKVAPANLIALLCVKVASGPPSPPPFPSRQLSFKSTIFHGDLLVVSIRCSPNKLRSMRRSSDTNASQSQIRIHTTGGYTRLHHASRTSRACGDAIRRTTQR
jgi:hypothetical protein